MRAVPNLPWPHNLFAMGQPMQQLTRVDTSNLCACGCRKRHSLAVSKVVTEEDLHGPTRRVLWFATWPCKVRWEADRVRG